MKLTTIALALNLVLGSAALAQTNAPPKPRTISLPHSLKPAGTPEVTIGPVAKGQVFYRRKLTYARMGVLTTTLHLTGQGGDVTLAAGTAMFGIVSAGPVTWCTFPQKDVRQVCLLHRSGASIWAEQSGDVTFLGMAAAPIKPDAAPEAQVDETQPVPPADFVVEYGLGDPSEVDKPIPLQNGQGYIQTFGPKAGMVVTIRYTVNGVQLPSGYTEYYTPSDVTLDGAKLSYDPQAKTFSVSTQ